MTNDHNVHIYNIISPIANRCFNGVVLATVKTTRLKNSHAV